jgi:hypothetical protein
MLQELVFFQYASFFFGIKYRVAAEEKTILDLTPQPRRLSGLRVDSEGFAISLMQSINKPTNYFSFQPFYHS